MERVKWNESITLYEMPNLAWDQKYYRKSFTQGLEALLVKRIAGNRWVALLPDLTFGAVTLTARSTIGSEPGEGIQWTRMPLLTEAQKVDNLKRATDFIAHGVSSNYDLVLYRPGRQVRQAFVAQAGLIALSWPSHVAQWLRWGLRTRRRFFGLGAALGLLYFAFDSFGVIGGVSVIMNLTRDFYYHMKFWALETSDLAGEVFRWFEDWHQFFATYVTFRQGLLVSACLVVLIYVWVMEGDEASTTSSAAGTPPASEVSDASGGDVRSLRETIEKQSGLLNDMLMAQTAMKQEIADTSDARTAQRAAEIRSQVEPSSAQHRQQTLEVHRVQRTTLSSRRCSTGWAASRRCSRRTRIRLRPVGTFFVCVPPRRSEW